MFILLDKLYGLINADLIKITLYRLDLMYDAKGLIHDMIEYYSKKKSSNNKTENKHARQLTEWVCSTCMFVKLFKHTPMKHVHYVLRILGKENWFLFLSWRKYGN